MFAALPGSAETWQCLVAYELMRPRRQVTVGFSPCSCRYWSKMFRSIFQASFVAFSLLFESFPAAAQKHDAKVSTAPLSSLSAALARPQTIQQDRSVAKKFLSPSLNNGIDQVMLNVPVGIVQTPVGLRVMVENMLVPAQAIISQNPLLMMPSVQQSTQQGSGVFPVVIQPGLSPAGQQDAAPVFQPQVAPQAVQQDTSPLPQPLASLTSSSVPVVPGPASGVPIGTAAVSEQQQQPSLPPVAASTNAANGASPAGQQVSAAPPQVQPVASTQVKDLSSPNPGGSARLSAPGRASFGIDTSTVPVPSSSSAAAPVTSPAAPPAPNPSVVPAANASMPLSRQAQMPLKSVPGSGSNNITNAIAGANLTQPAPLAPGPSIVPAANASMALSRQAQMPLKSGSESVSKNVTNAVAGINSTQPAPFKSSSNILPSVVSSNATGSRSTSATGNSTALMQGRSPATRKDDGLDAVIGNVYKNATLPTLNAFKPTPAATMPGKNVTQGLTSNMTLTRNSAASPVPIPSAPRPAKNVTQSAQLEASARQSMQSAHESHLQPSAMVHLNTTRMTLGFKASIKTSSAPIWSSVWYVSGCSSVITLLVI
ncbi:hypothetical protein BCR37DRAFT_384538 [Protomyces lactucae-debilis]|uniref:Uncharacterized protein n=1 Tax=Protomyces lactucae-debilis TaxID=2754530 RepID=A0A1Y2ER87_PROLT|nr:uncharacterized protein BCR37DRAFT_384538 [Protomyces lactucae-debilis]ORY74110.1 hypothetical protein BCR37DRAFT_384538 [Protomyces lactucae-debilis]